MNLKSIIQIEEKYRTTARGLFLWKEGDIVDLGLVSGLKIRNEYKVECIVDRVTEKIERNNYHTTYELRIYNPQLK